VKKYTFIALCFLLLSMHATVRSADLSWHEVIRQVYLMGTSGTLITYAQNRQNGIEQLEAFLEILEETERELSTWRNDSVLSRLNRHPVKVPFKVDKSLCRLFKDLLFWQWETGSAFDPAIGSLIEAWGIRQGGRWPQPEVLEAARALTGMRYFQFNPSLCEITREQEVRIEEGAFGKGEALDRVFNYTVKNKAAPWLINLGGQVMVYGHPPKAISWKVDIAHPRHRDQVLLTIDMTSGSLSISAGSEKDLQINGRRIGHILDPRTGYFTDFTGSVAVWHEQALVADILSTALYVMGPREGLVWAEARKLTACFFVIQEDRKVEILPSRDFKNRFDLSAE
jgi:thiamine biosynthesis lipoprotein